MKKSKFSKLLALASAFILSAGSHSNVVQAEETKTFNYTGSVQEVTLEPGSYLFEVYGAKGGNSNHGRLSDANGVIRSAEAITNTGYGSYSKGEIELTETTTFYIYVGGSGQDGTRTIKSQAKGGWNGGGNAGIDGDDDGSGGGGGASDIRLIKDEWDNPQSLYSRIIVAGGGSGAQRETGRSGDSAIDALDATQTRGYAFGYGGNGSDTVGAGMPGSGGGGGYYGGYPAPPADEAHRNIGDVAVAGGGSSFISGHAGCDAVLEDGTHTNQPNHYSGMVFTNTQIQSGVQNGSGMVKITSIMPDLYVLLDIAEIAQLSVTHDLLDNLPLIWKSTNPAVVIVDDNGVATAVGEGTAIVWAESLDGTFKESIPFKVLEGAEEMRLALHLNAGETKRLWFGNDPTAVNWLSMDPSVATIDANGNVNGVARGLCIMKAELNGVEKYIYVRVNE